MHLHRIPCPLSYGSVLSFLPGELAPVVAGPPLAFTSAFFGKSTTIAPGSARTVWACVPGPGKPRSAATTDETGDGAGNSERW
eukprot:3368377-Pyramimonas_sp.AAC.1